MKKSKRLGAALLAACLAAGSLAGCGSTAPTTAATEPQSQSAAAGENAADGQGQTEGLTPASGTVRILSNITGGKDDAETQLFAKALGEATGLEVIFEKPPADYNQVLMQKLQGGEKYDLIYISASQYLDLSSQGALLDITDWMNSSKIYQENVDPKEIEDLLLDGRIYAGFNKQELHRVVALNKKQLEAAGIDYQTIEPTLDGYYEVMKQLRDASSDIDYYPFNVVLSETWDIQPWMASVGVQEGVVMDTDGQTYVPYSTAEAAPVWEWFKKLYDENLMDPGAFVDKTKDMRAKMGVGSQSTGVCVDWAMWVGLQNAQAKEAGVSTDDYEIVSLPGVTSPDGSYMLVKGMASLFAIPVNSENPDAGKRVLEYFATQEGGELISIGIEGHDYTKEGDVYTLTEIGGLHGLDHGAPSPINKNFVHPIGYSPGVEEALGYLPYAKVSRIIPNDTDYKETVGKWGIRIVKGEVSIEEGLENMRKDLVALGVCDK